MDSHPSPLTCASSLSRATTPAMRCDAIRAQLTTVEEQREQQEHVMRLLARERKQNEEISRLEDDLAKAYEERDTEIEKRDQVRHFLRQAVVCRRRRWW